MARIDRSAASARKRIPGEPVSSYPNGSAAGGNRVVNIEGRAATTEHRLSCGDYDLCTHSWPGTLLRDIAAFPKFEIVEKTIVLYSTAQTSYIWDSTMFTHW
jgi:hypothetical protein